MNLAILSLSEFRSMVLQNIHFACMHFQCEGLGHAETGPTKAQLSPPSSFAVAAKNMQRPAVIAAISSS